MLIPSIIEIENVHGMCNASSVMCSIRDTKLPKHIMSTYDFANILDKFLPYRSSINNIDIVGLGESLLDTELCEKITIAKTKGFRNIAIATNAGLLDDVKSQKLLDSGLDIIIFSIDSLSPDKYSKIRKGLLLETTIKNINRFITQRNSCGYQTKIYARIILQDQNSDEWNNFAAFWSELLDLEQGDMILSFPAHNWADAETEVKKDMICPYVFDRIVINSRGDVQFCCIDFDADFYRLGNVKEQDPIELFNNEIFKNARKLMTEKEINRLHKCKYCDVPIKRQHRGYYQK